MQYRYFNPRDYLVDELERVEKIHYVQSLFGVHATINAQGAAEPTFGSQAELVERIAKLKVELEHAIKTRTLDERIDSAIAGKDVQTFDPAVQAATWPREFEPTDDEIADLEARVRS